MLMINEQETQRIMNFIAHCNQYIDGKYLFGATKLKEIYRDVRNSEELNQLFTECLDGFNVSLFKTKCLIKLPTKKGTFTSPTEKEDFVALAFAMIEDISIEEVDYDTFINKYFLSETDENRFGKQVIEPLKQTVAKLFDLPEDNETEFKIKTNIEQPKMEIDNLEAISICKNIISVISQKTMPSDHEKNAVVILFELINCLQEGNQNLILCLEIALTYLEKHIDGINYLFEELFFCLDKLV